MYQNPGFIKNLIVFIAGAIFIGTDFFSTFNLDQPLRYPVGGYMVISAYYARIFGSARFGNVYSLVVFWMLPFAAIFCLAASLIYGIVMSVPKFIMSFIKWKASKNRSLVQETASGHVSPFPVMAKPTHQNVAQPIRVPKRSIIVVFPGEKAKTSSANLR
ncbi:hypothetical protein [Paenibacillus sp. LPE1-1-1.1]|uniref:hypothetical protein n=1 Tax=Paenibacillus sp. LPE1-1-1.1 TaxID=3135230 RepID=UPI0034232A81